MPSAISNQSPGATQGPAESRDPYAPDTSILGDSAPSTSVKNQTDTGKMVSDQVGFEGAVKRGQQNSADARDRRGNIPQPINQQGEFTSNKDYDNQIVGGNVLNKDSERIEDAGMHPDDQLSEQYAQFTSPAGQATLEAGGEVPTADGPAQGPSGGSMVS